MISDLDLLGDAAPTPERLAGLVAEHVGVDVHDASGTVEVVAYDVPAISTEGRWWVRGEADTGDGPRAFSFFVKTVRPWELSPLFAQVPPELRDSAARAFPWRTEPDVYRSDLAGALPDGLRMPRCYAVEDLPGPRAAVWLEAVETNGSAWDVDTYVRAARLLGRFAGAPAVREHTGLAHRRLDAAVYLESRVSGQVVPILGSPIWEHPGLAPYSPLRDELVATIPRLSDLAREIDALPRLAGHGDACPGNLLREPGDGDGFVLIDYGLFAEHALGMDLTQLLVGDVAIGRRAAQSLGGLDALSEQLLTAYADGLALEDYVVDPAQLRRAHALEVFLWCGLSALPFEHLDLPVPQLQAIAVERAALTRFSLDLLAATEPVSAG